MKNRHKLITIAALTAATTATLHFINKLVDATAQLKDMLDTSNHHFFDWRFGDIYYTKRGKGSPVLLVHDALPGSSGYEWSRIEKELALEHTVYTVDLLGCGRSEKPGITYTNFVYVQMLSDFIKKVIGTKTDVIASGFSCSFVVMACHSEKELFDRIMLVNPPSLRTLNEMPTKRHKLLKMLLSAPVFGTFLYHIAVSREETDNLFTEKMYYNPFHVNGDVLDAYYEAAHKGGAYAKNFYSSIMSKYMNINITHALKSLNNSVYIVEGDSEIGGGDIVADYLEANPAIEAATVKGTKHLPHIENPEGFLEQVGIFFTN